MQSYRDGFYSGDPRIAPAAPGRALGQEQPDAVDVLVVGSGPAGNLLGAYLSQFPEISTRIIERRHGRLELGQADGIACRTVETFEAFGLASKLLGEAYWVNETSFWRPATEQPDNIERTGRIQDVEDGLSEFPHVIVNQARIHDYLLDFMEQSPTRLTPDYGLEFVSLETDNSAEYPVTATFRDVETGDTRVIRTKYLIGTDGARSGVRKSIGRSLHGDAAGHAWGVMDILLNTDFPDIRLKSAIQSSHEGSILLIPREGGYLARLYIDLGEVNEENRAQVRGISDEEMVSRANRVLHPYSIEVHETVWSSVYEVAQRVTDGFDNVASLENAAAGETPSIFIAGDACHTHSAKAGQGMNVSMQDTLNLGWKLSSVLRGTAGPELLNTYSDERQPVAQRLIDFDREWSAMMAAGPKDPQHPERGGVDPAELEEYFVQAGKYTAGVGTQYTASTLTGTGAHQSLAKGFEVGTRFHSAPVTRVADAMRMELGHVHRADGRFRLYLFADQCEEKFTELCNWLDLDDASPVNRHTPEGWDIDSVIDVRGIVQRAHRDVDPTSLPRALRPRIGRYGLIDHEKAFSAKSRENNNDLNLDIFEMRGIDRDKGAIVVVRPDQYVADVLPLDAHYALTEYFAGILR